ncbi:MAG: hypothetical protein Q8O79_05105, partial [Pseudomonadota bacterium]|nr:hypothetical protein [Pseudomonadota bacterium]
NLHSSVEVLVGANLFAQSSISVRINSHLQISRNGLNRNEFLCQLRNPGSTRSPLSRMRTHGLLAATPVCDLK